MACPDVDNRAEIVNDGFLVLGNDCAQIFHSTYTPHAICTSFDAPSTDVKHSLCAGKLTARIVIFRRVLGSELTCHETRIFSNRLGPSFCHFTLHQLFDTHHKKRARLSTRLTVKLRGQLRSITPPLVVSTRHLRATFLLLVLRCICYPISTLHLNNGSSCTIGTCQQ